MTHRAAPLPALAALPDPPPKSGKVSLSAFVVVAAAPSPLHSEPGKVKRRASPLAFAFGSRTFGSPLVHLVLFWFTVGSHLVHFWFTLGSLLVHLWFTLGSL